MPLPIVQHYQRGCTEPPLSPVHLVCCANRFLQGDPSTVLYCSIGAVFLAVPYARCTNVTRHFNALVKSIHIWDRACKEREHAQDRHLQQGVRFAVMCHSARVDTATWTHLLQMALDVC
jgi:hypothetical protein